MELNILELKYFLRFKKSKGMMTNVLKRSHTFTIDKVIAEYEIILMKLEMIMLLKELKLLHPRRSKSY